MACDGSAGVEKIAGAHGCELPELLFAEPISVLPVPDHFSNRKLMTFPFKTDTHDKKLMVALIPGLRECAAHRQN